MTAAVAHRNLSATRRHDSVLLGNMGSGGPGHAAAPMQDASEPPICDHVELRNAQGLQTYALYWPNRFKLHCRALSLQG
jgi:hypothetical protein